MKSFALENTTLDRLPMALSGIAYTKMMITGEVCPKLNSFLKQVSYLYL